MDIISLCENFSKIRNEEEKLRTVRNIIKRYYVPITEKVNILNNLAENSVVKTGINYIDFTCSKIQFTKCIIELYTTLDFDKNENFEKYYDALKETETLDFICLVVKKDLDELLLIQKDCLDTVYNKYCSIVAVLQMYMNSQK